MSKGKVIYLIIAVLVMTFVIAPLFYFAFGIFRMLGCALGSAQ